MRKNLTTLFFLLITFMLSAQQQLSLADAIQVGLANNYDMLLEKHNLSLAELNNSWGETNIFPSLSASIRGSNNTFDNQQAINPFSIIGKTVVNQIQPSVQLNWNLMQVYNLSITKKRLEQLQEESAGNADVVIQNTLQAIILGYYAAVLEKERMQQFEQQVALSRDKYTRLQARKSLGSAITSDLLLAEGNYLSDSVSLINQQLAHKKAVSNLNFLLGIEEPAAHYILSDSLDREIRDISLEELMSVMELGNIDLKKLYLTQSVLELDTELRKSDRYPSLTLGADYRLTYNRQDVRDWPKERRQIRDSKGNVIDELTVGTNTNTNYGANFTISFNLFNGGKINRAIQRAKLRENIGAMQIDKLKISLKRNLKQAFDQYTARRKVFEINQRRKQSTFQNLQINKEKFQSGTINSFDYRDIQNNYLLAAVQELQSAYNLIDAKITILRLTGGLMQEYVTE